MFPHQLGNIVHSFFFFNSLFWSHVSFIYLFIYLFMFALGLRCCTWASLVATSGGLLLVEVRGLLIAVASLVAEHGL